MSRACIVCGASIRKRTVTWSIRLPRAANGVIEEKLEGDIKRDAVSVTLYTRNRPRSKADCQLLTNQPVVSVRRWPDGYIYQFSVWDGESYESQFFCSNRCAIKQGIASAEHGHRYKWS